MAAKSTIALFAFFSFSLLLMHRFEILFSKTRDRKGDADWARHAKSDVSDRPSRLSIISPYIFASRCWIYPALTMGRRWRSH
ncbi:uncharacterized protein BO97DRAFT_401878 [Aspergillus homomorphus CBS 101889]|uniref:Uncharacterized protein n=1 Tax=Aspergillus homomorphus (strain CBS 101889) TaxID=1450537 RepID=A0A395IAZ1_ASPHC|nr:hypothetical protein BO97DRAFT_401878 [Aspergillus homomorphus CBS 101889]RAL17191.1 hypothetical protein BO97DRAFT_401878 [Aspergillus homomorphus CBS 101889]